MSGAIKRVSGHVEHSVILISRKIEVLHNFAFFSIFQTTGLTGLAVSSNPHHTLGVLYNKILSVVQKMPANTPYRTHTETLVNERNKIVLAVSPLTMTQTPA